MYLIIGIVFIREIVILASVVSIKFPIKMIMKKAGLITFFIKVSVFTLLLFISNLLSAQTHEQSIPKQGLNSSYHQDIETQREKHIEELRAKEKARMEQVYFAKIKEIEEQQKTESKKGPSQNQKDSEIDKAALIALYNATDGDNWTDNTNWLSDEPIGDWYGVNTDQSGYVISINLWNNALAGSIPAELGSLSNLIGLSFFNNQLTGSIPSEMGSLTNLQWLELGENELTGSIPSQLGDLSNLSSLNLNDNQLSEGVPSELSNLSVLNNLDLRNNTLDVFPSELSSLTLEWAHATSNNFTFEDLINFPDGLAYNPQNTIHLNDTINLDSGVEGTIQLGFDNSTTNSTYNWYRQGNLVTSTTVNHLDITEEYGGTFHYSLEITNTEFPEFTLEVDSIIVIVEGESLLDIERDILVTFYNATNGDNWTDNTNWLSEEPLDQWYGVNIDGNGYVTNITLSFNNLVGNIPTELSNLTTIEVLMLNNNQLSGNIPAELGYLSNLQYLYLSSNQLSGTLPSNLGSLSNLQNLYLHGNQLSGSIPKELVNLSNLQRLYLYNNQLSGNIPPEIGSLSNLQDLNLAYNQLTGDIPTELGDLSNLQELHLYYNQLTGIIPPEIGNLSNLQGLYLVNNQFSGPLPPEISNMSNLKYLYLYSNRLTGGIPVELENLSNLIELKINDNLFDNFPVELNSLVLSSINTEKNNFTFEDILNMPNGTDFNPQNIIHLNEIIKLEVGDNSIIQLDFDHAVENCTYNWYKNGVYVTSTIVNSLSITENSQGIYNYSIEITNTASPGFTLVVDAIIIEVTEEVTVLPINLTVNPNGLATWEGFAPMYEGFNEERDFDNWEVSTGGFNAHTWHWNSAYNNNTLDGTPMAFVDSDAAGNTSTMDEYLISRSFDASSVSSLYIEFDQYYKNIHAEEKADVQVYNGSEWITVLHQNSSKGSWETPDHITIDVSAYSNEDFRIRFYYYTEAWDWYWAIDNVWVYSDSENKESKGFENYNVYLDGELKGNTVEKLFQHNTNELIAEQTYLTELSLVQTSGESDKISYEWTFSPETMDLQWTGQVSNDWHNSLNWSPEAIPLSNTNITILSNATQCPTLNESGQCHDITLQSNASGTASILDNSNLSIYGQATIERYFSGNGWHLVSSPISNATANVFSDMYLQYFNKDDYLYYDIVSANIPLNKMKGYAVYSDLNSENTVTFIGNMNHGTAELDFGLGLDVYNWNLLGNPYPSSINWEEVNIPNGMSNEIHYFNAVTENWMSYVQGTGGSGLQFIPPHQGFFISTTQSGTLTFNDNVRTHSGNDNFAKKPQNKALILRASNNEYSDETWVHFNDIALLEHDGVYDAYKMLATTNLDLPQLYTFSPSGVILSVNGSPQVESIDLGFQCQTGGGHVISAVQEIENTKVILEDKQLNIFVDLSESDYEFEHAITNQVNRFTLHFSFVGLDEINHSSVKIYSNDKTIYLKSNTSIEGDLLISDMSGRIVFQQNIKSSKLHSIPVNYSNGYYLVQYISKSEKIVKKVYIK